MLLLIVSCSAVVLYPCDAILVALAREGISFTVVTSRLPLITLLAPSSTRETTSPCPGDRWLRCGSRGHWWSVEEFG